ncbi:hypothetical protein V5O48_015031 [Marasmius crinis-equi]|uniref:Ubiquitin 3 binding protein But2 C-terminal domain-containing protein n=1 Tax=Marasmius crinis-equi TaxID=585013 RepID=A0ABR3EVP5_9AGAR
MIPEGYVPTGQKRVLVNEKVYSIAHFRTMDWGMENCRFVFEIPASNDTDSKFYKYAVLQSATAAPVVRADIWRVETQAPVHARPKRLETDPIASLDLTYGSSIRSSMFTCKAASLYDYEIEQRK